MVVGHDRQWTTSALELHTVICQVMRLSIWPAGNNVPLFHALLVSRHVPCGSVASLVFTFPSPLHVHFPGRAQMRHSVMPGS